MHPVVTWVLFAGSVVLGLALQPACSPAELRAHTYPPSFEYIPKDKLSLAMWRMAGDVQVIQAVLRASDPVDSGAREEIVRRLNNMDHALSSIDAPGRRTNHPLIDRKSDAFLRDLRLARQMAEAEPPTFILAAAVTGSCRYCHGGLETF